LGKPLSPRKLHEYRCFLLGISDKETVDQLWREAERELAADAPKKGVRRERR
jgi:hypothetical protein